MGAMDHQCGFFDESTYGTSGTPTRFFEYDSESISEVEGRTEGDPLRVGSGFIRSDRSTPYFAGASGDLEMAVLTKGFGFFLKHMMGAVATTGPAETTVYTHTGTEGNLLGKSLTMQLNRPFHPTGTNQPFLYKGGKITDWELSNSVDENLMLKLGLDFQQVDTVTALATASYPATMDNFTWAGGVVEIGGSSYDITEFALKVDNGLKTDRRQIRGNTDKKEPTSSRRKAEFAIKADFDSMTQRNRAHATTRAATLAQIVATWTGPTLLGSTIYPTFQVTIPAARFDEWKGATEGTEAIEQELKGEVRFDGSASPVTVVYKSADTTP
jgi:hypothetical protein